jgi:hypothetical protein
MANARIKLHSFSPREPARGGVGRRMRRSTRVKKDAETRHPTPGVFWRVRAFRFRRPGPGTQMIVPGAGQVIGSPSPAPDPLSGHQRVRPESAALAPGMRRQNPPLPQAVLPGRPLSPGGASAGRAPTLKTVDNVPSRSPRGLANMGPRQGGRIRFNVERENARESSRWTLRRRG